jgi:uncharacterized protein YkwD
MSFLSVGFGQALPEDYSAIDHSILNKHIIKEVNTLRKSKRLQALSNDTRLFKAAEDHACYLTKKKSLLHTQHKKNKKNPWDRLSFYEVQFNSCGENLQYIQPMYPFQLKKEKQATEFQTYERLAKVLVTNWRYSKMHYKNIINKYFTHSYVICCYDPEGKRLIAVQLFASY